MRIPDTADSVSGENGFALIEALVAIAIFAVGIVGCYTMQLQSSLSARKSNNMTASAIWATYVVENLLALHFDNPLLQNDAGNTGNGLVDIDDANKAGDTPDGVRHVRSDGTIGNTAAAGDIYSVFWNVSDGNPLSNVKQVRVIVIKNTGANARSIYTHDYYKTNENL